MVTILTAHLKCRCCAAGLDSSPVNVQRQ
jgi:hypothetical protein